MCILDKSEAAPSSGFATKAISEAAVEAYAPSKGYTAAATAGEVGSGAGASAIGAIDLTRVEAKVTDLRGKECKIQPQPGQIPVLEPGKSTKGCQYIPRSGQKSEAEVLPPLDTAAMYRSVASSNFRIELRTADGGRMGGSGVMVAKGDGVCYVATDHHVVVGDKDEKIVSRGVIPANGKVYPASVEIKDKNNDRALI